MLAKQYHLLYMVTVLDVNLLIAEVVRRPMLGKFTRPISTAIRFEPQLRPAYTW